MSESKIKVLSLNCWGLKYVSKDREDRMRGIADVLSKSDYDIVALQEVWVSADYTRLRDSMVKILPHAKYFYSGALGSGLAIFSRFPIISATIHPYSLNGSPIDVVAGDWFVGKAAASVLLAHPVLGQVHVFNTHLFAKGGETGPLHNRAHRLVNAWEFSKLTRQSAELGRYVIAAGDFNTIPGTVPMEIIRDHAGLTDAWRASHLSTPTTPPSSLTPEQGINSYGTTADSPINSYSAGKHLESVVRQFWGKRLDYVFFRDPARLNAADSAKPTLTCTKSKVVFTDRVLGRDFSYSDHFGFEAVLDITAPRDTSNADPPPPMATYLSPSTTLTILQTLTQAYRHSLRRSRGHLTTFVACLSLLLVLIISSPWIPYFLSPIYLIITVALAWWATTMLYVGFVYGRWEVNALMNVIEELELYKSALGVHYEVSPE